MNNITPEQWAEELRKPERMQCRRSLRESDYSDEPQYSYCCLGVLADQLDSSLWTENTAGMWNGHSATIFGTDRPEWLSQETAEAAVYANDVLQWDFNQIADWVERGAPIYINHYRLHIDGQPLQGFDLGPVDSNGNHPTSDDQDGKLILKTEIRERTIIK